MFIPLNNNTPHGVGRSLRSAACAIFCAYACAANFAIKPDILKEPLPPENEARYF